MASINPCHKCTTPLRPSEAPIIQGNLYLCQKCGNQGVVAENPCKTLGLSNNTITLEKVRAKLRLPEWKMARNAGNGWTEVDNLSYKENKVLWWQNGAEVLLIEIDRPSLNQARIWYAKNYSKYYKGNGGNPADSLRAIVDDLDDLWSSLRQLGQKID